MRLICWRLQTRTLEQLEELEQLEQLEQLEPRWPLAEKAGQAAGGRRQPERAIYFQQLSTQAAILERFCVAAVAAIIRAHSA